ncbi:MAG TPA: FKBP-type peptidyl-prolyl cis-trans isomerase [Alphaproteobacteria bacterium]|nr:FKBP-type peptidyl-prolyl cis-trans isomerase [Alphaproteobacteria bacterium]
MKKSLLALGFALAFSFALTVTAAAQSSTTGTTKKAAAPQTTKAPAAAKKAAPAKPAEKPAPPALADQKQKASYALGISVGSNFRRQGLTPEELDADSYLRGVKDALQGNKAQLTPEEMQAAVNQLQVEVQTRMKLLAEANKKAGDAFLAENKTKPGVVTLPSGLQYKIITEGTGPKPTLADTVNVNYRGTLINGTEFDSSYPTNAPAPLAVGRVIRGWTEALQLMPVGSKWQLFIPSELAYGPSARSELIGPNSTLIFDVELVSIQPKPELPATPEPKK